MAKKILISTVVIGANRYYAGALLDESAEADAIAAVVAAGGQLLDTGDPVVDAAALTAQQKLRDGQWREVDGVMLAAVSKSAYEAAAAVVSTGPQRDFSLNGYSSDVNTLSIAEDTASQSAVGQWGEGLRTAVVVFPAGWDGGDLVLSGTARGAAVAETFTSPGAGGGTVVGVKVFANLNLITNTAPGGAGAQAAQVQLGRRFGTTRAPLSSVEKLSVGGDIATPAAVSLAEGWVELPAPYAQGTSVEIRSVLA